MKILISIVVVVAVLIGIFAVIPAFIDEDVSFSRSIEINKPVDLVYGVTKNLEYYQQWNAWSQSDSNAVNELTGTPGEVGSKMSWAGEIVGTGSLTIEELVENKSIKSKLEFVLPWQGVALDLWDFEQIDSTTTKVNWTYSGKMDSYLMRYMNLAIEGMVGPQFEIGLTNLKELIENMPVQQAVEKEEILEN